MKVKLEEWAAQHFRPVPSLWTLRRMARDGEITPPPVKVGRDWLVEESARLTVEVPQRPGLVSRLQGAGA